MEVDQDEGKGMCVFPRDGPGSEFTICNAQLILSACIYRRIEHLLKSPWFCLSSVPPSITREHFLENSKHIHTDTHHLAT